MTNIISSMMGTKNPTACTPNSRLLDLRKAAADFSNHLTTSSGMILTADLRLGVAIYARNALIKSSNKSDFPMRSQSNKAIGSNDVENLVDTCLISIIDPIINHQSKLDAKWYQECNNSIRACGFLNNYTKCNQCADDTNELELASHAAFCEIILLAAISHGIHTTFLSLGQNVPPLPTFEEMQGGEPLNIRFSSLLHRVRRDDSISEVSPYFLKRDLNKNSVEYPKLKDILDDLYYGPTPWQCSVFSPYDTVMAIRYLDVFYLPMSDMILSWNELDSTNRCSSVTRLDTEALAEAIAAKYDCGF